jgi:hypothetical protein
VHVHRECKFLRICFCSCHIIPFGRENYSPSGERDVPPPHPSPLLIERSRGKSDLRFGLWRWSGNASNAEKTQPEPLFFSRALAAPPAPLFKHPLPRSSSFDFELRAIAARFRGPFSLGSLFENARFMRV